MCGTVRNSVLQKSGGTRDCAVECSLSRLSPWGERGGETEPLCVGHQEELAQSLFSMKTVGNREVI